MQMIVLQIMGHADLQQVRKLKKVAFKLNTKVDKQMAKLELLKTEQENPLLVLF